MLSYFQAIILGLLQGISELFPISSLGHSVIITGLLGWSIDRHGNYFLAFLVATHFATALTLFCIYWKDWVRIISGIFRSALKREISDADTDAKLGWLLVVGTVPAGMVGLLFQDQVKKLLISPIFVALFLAANGALLYLAEILRKKAKGAGQVKDADRSIAADLSWWQSLKVGMMQIIALLPGFSRTGSTIAGGLMVGLSHEDALRFSFLLATPIIGAAAALKLPGLLASGNRAAIGTALVGGLCAAIAAYLAVKFLTRYFKTRTLTPFAIYCALFGLLSLSLLR
jgi:undecaprenyl-diphosphatase